MNGKLRKTIEACAQSEYLTAARQIGSPGFTKCTVEFHPNAISTTVSVNQLYKGPVQESPLADPPEGIFRLSAPRLSQTLGPEYRS